MTTTTLRTAMPAPAARGSTRGAGMLAWLRAALARHDARQALARMDDHLLADVGLTREQALREAARPFWSR